MGRQYIEPMKGLPSQARLRQGLHAGWRLAAGLTQRLPGQCAVCRDWTPGRICAACVQRWAQAVPRCWSCALRLPPGADAAAMPRCGRCLREPPPLSRCIAALDYAFPWDALLQRFKFGQALDLGPALVGQMSAALDAAEVARPEWLLPVPLSPQRLRERGYNQSWELARALARRRSIACAPTMLVRVRDTAHQLQLAPEARAANVREAFAVDPQYVASLRGRHVVLLDDVMTTGATLHELARTLLRAGVTKVDAWVLARTPESLH
jgi:ComF family protein